MNKLKSPTTPTPMEKKTEQCFCQSYWDDDGLQDCTCGKCAWYTPVVGKKVHQIQGWEEEFDRKFRSTLIPSRLQEGLKPNTVKKFIRSLLDQTLEEQNRIHNSGRKLYQIGQREERKALVEKIGEWARLTRDEHYFSLNSGDPVTTVESYFTELFDLLSTLQEKEEK